MLASLAKMIIKQNQKLTFEEVYDLFYTQFPHIRYIDDKHELHNSLKCLHLRKNLLSNDYPFEQCLYITLVNEKVICASKEKDIFTLVGDNISINYEHNFKVYNKPLSNDELLELIFKNA